MDHFVPQIMRKNDFERQGDQKNRFHFVSVCLPAGTDGAFTIDSCTCTGTSSQNGGIISFNQSAVTMAFLLSRPPFSLIYKANGKDAYSWMIFVRGK